MVENRNKKFIYDILIYAVGNIGSKLILFIMVPLYTFFIDANALGYYDLSISILFLLVPVITLDLRDGIFRFLLNPDEDHVSVISSTFIVLFINCAISIIPFIIIGCFFSIPYSNYLFATLVVYCVYEVETQALRGIKKTIVFTYSGLLSALVTCFLSVFLLKYFGAGIKGIYIANIISRIICILFIEYKTRFFINYFNVKKIRKSISVMILKYTIPLLPNVICWWLISSSGKLFVEHFLGLSQNGIYAVVTKFSDSLFIFSYIFYQSWQETAIKEFNSPDKNVFFSNIFNKYFNVLVVLAVVFSLLLKIFFDIIVDAKYAESLFYILPSMIGVIFLAMSSFLDLGYQCSFQTKKTLPSIVSATILNVFLNYLLISQLQLYGVILSTIITYVYLFIYRLIDTRKFFKIKIKSVFWYSMLLFAIGFYSFYYISSIPLLCLIVVLFAFGVLLINKNIIYTFVKK